MQKSVNGQLVEMTAQEESDFNAWVAENRGEQWKAQRRDGPDGYGSIHDQLDMLWNDMTDGNLDTSGSWYRHRAAVNAAIPEV